LAARLAEALAPAVIVPSDDFYAAHISNAEWEVRSPAERARDAIDWRRLRAEALEPLLAGRRAKWHPFDFEAPRPDGTYPPRARPETRPPARLIILEGAYCARPELSDLIDFSILVDAPQAVRHARLGAREEPAFLAAWHARWDAAEAHYFTQVRSTAAFDLVVRGE
jgi:uridine kinase